MTVRRIHSRRQRGRARWALSAPSGAVVAMSLAACAGAPTSQTTAPSSRPSGSYPVTVSSCGFQATVTSPPKRMVTLNQGATEVALALGLQRRMAGTAYLDDTIPAKWKHAYQQVPTLSTEYPSKEKLLASRPDFVYASYASAFTDKVAGTRAELAKGGVSTYLSPFGCAKKSRAAPTTWASVWNEVSSVAKAFDVSPRADKLVADQRRLLTELSRADAGKGLTALWYDSGTKSPFVGAGHGGPSLILKAVGAHNVFDHLPGGWATVSWEKVVAANPDVIVLADASWDSAASKISYLEHDPVLGKLTAVRKHRFVIVPFSESTPGVRLADGAATVSNGLHKLHLTSR